MGWRDTINNQAPWFTAAAVVLMVVALVVFYESMSPEEPWSPAPRWYYDLNRGRLFVSSGDQVPPILAPGQATDEEPAGVAAHVISCGSCSAERRKVLYLEKWSPEVRAQIQAMRSRDDPSAARMRRLMATGRLIKRPGDTEWVPYDSEEAEQIREAEFSFCDGQAARRCAPDEPRP